MNQILITEKLYITPELKRKRKIYKFNFLISVFLVCILTSFYIYAEYDRNKSEETSHQLLTEISQLLTTEEDSLMPDENILLVVLDGTEKNYTIPSNTKDEVDLEKLNEEAEIRTSPSGFSYKVIATVNIPSINTTYPVLQGLEGTVEETEELLKISPCKFHGKEPNQVGNFCIVGHNYRNTKFFSKVLTLSVGDTVELTDLSGRVITYAVYDKHTVSPDNTNDTTQLTGGKRELTLITCTNDSQQRVIVRCKEV